jgi:hypothetical protein
MLLKVLRHIPFVAMLCVPAFAGPSLPIPDDTLISMQRGNCEVMECPVYRVVVFANGDVVWQGRGRVFKLGVALGRIERDQIRTLIRRFESIDYFHLENIYGYRGAGCRSSAPYKPIVITSLSMGGVSKTLSHDVGCVGDVSQTLTDLENEIDNAAGTARWTAGKSTKRLQ